METKLRCTLCTHLVLGPFNERYPLKLPLGQDYNVQHITTHAQNLTSPVDYWDFTQGNLQTLSYTLPPFGTHAIGVPSSSNRWN